MTTSNGSSTATLSPPNDTCFSARNEYIQIEKVIAHGLGYLLPPKKAFDKKLKVHLWVSEAWDYIVRGALCLPCSQPGWFDKPAMMRFTINTPEVLRALQKHQVGLPYRDRNKPFGFGLIAITRQTRNSSPVTPITAFTDDLDDILERPWINTHDEELCTLALPGEALPGDVEVQTYGELVGQYRWHPEAKSLGPDGSPCSELTIGLLGRTPVTAVDFQSIGKETDRRWENEDDISILEQHRLEYDHSRRTESSELEELREKLTSYPAQLLADESGISIRTIKAIRNGRCIPKPETVTALNRALEALGNIQRTCSAKSSV